MRTLTRMRVKDQIDDLIFDDEKSRIQKELARLEELAKETNRNADEWVELVADTFNFAYSARMQFEHGDPKTKRYLFSKLGSNFLLKDKKLALNLNRQYFAFTPEYKSNIKPLELDENVLVTLEKNDLVPADLTWLAKLPKGGTRSSLAY